MKIITLTALILAAQVAAVGPAGAGVPDSVARGRGIAQSYCSGCHAIGPTGASPRREAPPFRDLHRRYDVGQLEEALAEGIMVGHPAMPEIRLWPEEVAAFIVYLRSLEPAPPPTAGAPPRTPR